MLEARKEYPLVDTLIVPRSGKISAVTDGKRLWSNCRHFPDGSRKLKRHCNMVLDGQVGVPYEFHARSLDIHLINRGRPSDIRKVVSGAYLEFRVGPSIITRGPMAMMSPYLDGNYESTTAVMSASAAKGWPFLRIPLSHVSPGSVSTVFVIGSQTVFGCDAEIDAGPLSGPVEMTFVLRGTLVRTDLKHPEMTC